MDDFSVVNVPAMLARQVRSYEADGKEITDDGEWHRRGAETLFVLAEFLASKSIVSPEVDVSRRPDLVIRFSQLNEVGRAFVMSQAVDQWMGSLDRRKPGTPITADGLERRWRKFLEEQ
jgi:hypothetical protein